MSRDLHEAVMDGMVPAPTGQGNNDAGGADAAAPHGTRGTRLKPLYNLFAVLSCLAIVAAFVTIVLGVVGRQVGFNIPGLDAYAGYAIAAALFLALPQTLMRDEHIRVTLVLQRLGPRGRAVLEWWSLLAGFGLACYLAWYAGRLSWLSWETHDVSSSSDATPLWIPQLAMVAGCVGLAVAFADALLARLQDRSFFESSDAARSE